MQFRNQNLRMRNNASGIWQNKAAIIDKDLITSRELKNLLTFNKAIIKKLSEYNKQLRKIIGFFKIVFEKCTLFLEFN